MSSPSILGSPTYSLNAIASALLGGLAVSASLVAVARDYPALLVVIVPSILLSVVLGFVARRQVRRSEGRVQGAGLARWGIRLGLIGTGFVLLLPAV
jgi:hypothetical protein